jgi:uncharacterized membrane protein
MFSDVLVVISSIVIMLFTIIAIYVLLRRSDIRDIRTKVRAWMKRKRRY